MTIEQTKLAGLGSGYWLEYVRVNGYSWRPTEKGLAKLSRLLDLNKAHIRKAIYLYLEA
jgi:hypothetical protein